MSDTEPPPRWLQAGHPRLARGWRIGQRLGDVVLLLHLAGGELAARYVLATQRPGAVAFAITAGSVAAMPGSRSSRWRRSGTARGC